MAVVGDVFRIKMCADLFGQDVCNIFYYIVATWTGNVVLTDILNQFNTQVVAKAKLMQSNSVLYGLATIEDSNDPSQYAEIVLTGAGALSATPSMPSYVAFGFKLVRTDRTTHNGAKRFAGVVEGAVVGNDVTGPTSTIYTDMQTALAATLTVTGAGGGTATLKPVIVRFSPLDPLQISEMNYVKEAIIKPQVTTQNSRKVGRGD